jgi:hypothetical protein
VCIGGSRAAPPEDCASARVIAQAEGVPFPFNWAAAMLTIFIEGKKVTELNGRHCPWGS